MSETISEARGGNALTKFLRNKRVLNVISIVLFYDATTNRSRF